MGKLQAVFVLVAISQVFSFALASAPLDDTTLNVQLNVLRIKNELKNAQLEAEIADVFTENRVKAARNTIGMHVNEAKVHLKASKGWMKPNGLNIAECVNNATIALSHLPTAGLDVCARNSMASVNALLVQLRQLAMAAEHVVWTCHLNEPADVSGCVDRQIESTKSRAEDIHQAVRDAGDDVRMDTCVEETLKEIFVELSTILASGFADCVYNEVIE